MAAVPRQGSVTQMLELRVPGNERRKTLGSIKWKRNTSSFKEDTALKKWEKAPEETAGFLSRFSLFFVFPVFKQAFRLGSKLQLEHVPPLPENLKPINTSKKLKVLWEKQKALAVAEGKKPSLRRAILSLVLSRLTYTLFLLLCALVLNLFIPLLTGQVVKAVSHDLGETETALLPVALFFTTLVGTFLMQKAFLNQTYAAIASWGGLTTLILEHPAQMTSAERGRFTEGQVLNLLSVDSQAVMDVMMFTGFFLVTPFQVVVCAILLLLYLGPIFLAGFAILAVNVYVCERLAGLVKKQQFKKNVMGDKRNLILNETLQGVRTVKLYSWEDHVTTRVTQRREAEIKILKQMGRLRGIQAFLSFGMPTVAMVVTFALYQYLRGDLNADTVFVSVGLFEMLNMGMAVLPNAVNEVQRMITSIDRIGVFLSSSATYQPDDGSTPAGVVSVTDADFCWEDLGTQSLEKAKKKKFLQRLLSRNREPSPKPSAVQPSMTPVQRPAVAPALNEDTDVREVTLDNKNGHPTKDPNENSKGKKDEGDGLTLRNISMHVKAGELVAVVGRVGSGKTTLASSLLHLVKCARGSVSIGGRCAFVPQQAFVLNDTVRNNITFGMDFDEKKYKDVLRACCLEMDVSMLPAGDESEVGEKGITISGGQKQRLAIARAAYADPDVVVLDDPLSAMDAHVGKQVFDGCLRGDGPLGKCTRVMCTNQVHLCQWCDRVLVLVDGRVVEEGTHAELMKKRGEYYSLALHVVGTDTDDARARTASVESVGDAVPAPHTVVADDASKITEPEDNADPDKAQTDDTPAQSDDLNKNGAHNNKNGDNSKPNDVTTRPRDGTLMTKEGKAKGRIGTPTFFRLCSAARSQVLGVEVVSLVIICPLLQYAVNVSLAKWSDDFNTEGTASIFFKFYIISAAVFAISAGVRSVVYNYFFVRASESLHNRMLVAVMRSPVSFFDTTPLGRVLNRFAGDVMQLDLLFPRLFEIWAYLAGMTIVIVVVAGVVVPYMLVISFLLLAVFMLLYRYFGAVVLEMRRVLMMSYSPITAFFSGYINGLDSIRAFGRIDVFFKRFEKMQVGPVTSLYYLNTIQTFANAIIMSLAVASFLALLALALIVLRDTKFVTPGYAGLLLSYCSVLTIRVPAVFLITTMLEQLLSAVQRIIEYIGLPQEKSTRPGVTPVTVDEKWPARGAVEMDNVVMAYRPGLPDVLRGVSFSILPGEKVGVVGRTGAGKSSLVLALFRMVEIKSGSIKIDGFDIGSVPLHLVRHRLGMIPQDPFLFSGSIRTNLDVTGEHSDEELWRALKLVNLESVVRAFSDGLEHEVKEKGQNFSAGTVQLMCLARVLLKNPTVIVMDEATASVDLETDAFVQQTIRQAFSSCTIITIAHRLNTIIDYDKIIVMDAGVVAEVGSPHELLKDKSGLFSNLVRHTGESSEKELRSRAKAKQQKGTEL